jgi:hypothetical protein
MAASNDTLNGQLVTVSGTDVSCYRRTIKCRCQRRFNISCKHTKRKLQRYLQLCEVGSSPELWYSHSIVANAINVVAMDNNELQRKQRNNIKSGNERYVKRVAVTTAWM